jgi:[ribosomal protein S5]-alanine N-acetyltransferase
MHGVKLLAPWEPVRAEHYFTEAGQRADIEQALEKHQTGNALPCVILDDDGAVVGRITLNGIVRQSQQAPLTCSSRPVDREDHIAVGHSSGATAAVRGEVITHLPVVGG